MDDFILICIGILIAAVVLHKFYDKPFFPPEPKINPDEEKEEEGHNPNSNLNK